MVIYVVMPGDSVYSIAARYGVSQAKIVEENGLDQIPHLVVGQALVIPTSERAHFVVPGESLWSISQKYGSSEESIMELNGIKSGEMLFPGTVIRIPERAKKYGVIETNAFIQPSTEEHEKSVVGEAAPDLTYISAFSHHVNADGSLTPLKDETIINTAKQDKAVPMLSVTNLTENNFSTSLIDSILKSESLEQTVINNIKALISQGNYYGVIIDFERISPENRELYNNFLRKLAAEIHSMGKLLATALAPKNYDIKEGSWHGAHDYKAHGEIVDFVVIMTYEWGWSGGPPMAVAPINEVKKVINYAVSVMPPKKIMMGMPFYGYDWTLPYTPKSEFAESIGCLEAVSRAATNGAIIRYDYQSQSPFYNYYDKSMHAHVVWFEDARSVMAKYLLANQYGLRGVSYWALGKPFPQNWAVLEDMFKITKLQ